MRELFRVRTAVRRLAIVTGSLLLALQPLTSWATSPVRLGRKSLTTSVTRTLLTESAAGRRVLDMVGNDERAARGLVQLARLAAKPGQTNKQVVASLGRALFLLERELAPGGGPRLRTVLGDLTDLVEWSKTRPGARAQLEKVASGMALPVPNLSKGSAYEIHLAATYLRPPPPPPPPLREIQPQAGPGDTLLFRDARIRPQGGRPAYVEAKNWPFIAEELARKKLRGQVNSHFERLKNAGRSVEPLPPGHQLLFRFNDRMPDSWKRAIRASTIRALQKHHGLSKDQARAWASANLAVGLASIPAAP